MEIQATQTETLVKGLWDLRQAGRLCPKYASHAGTDGRGVSVQLASEITSRAFREDMLRTSYGCYLKDYTLRKKTLLTCGNT